jgi:uncharacterized membrane protein YbaN (DUF454 family)
MLVYEGWEDIATVFFRADMTQESPTTSQSPSVAVRVSSADGVIHVQAPAIFVANDDATINSLMERLFDVSAVQTVGVNRENLTIDIHFDQTIFDEQTALRTLSERLLAPDQSRNDSLMHQYLSRVPGRLKRVERRLPDEATPRGGAHLHPAESLVVVENLIVEYDPAPGSKPIATEEVSTPSQLPTGGTLPADVTRPWIGQVVIGGIRRIVYLTAAGGCLVMSIVGLITPGIPTVPFVLATGYFLARSSPRMHEKFRRAPLFGPMITDYEDLGGLRWTTKAKAILFTIGLIAVTVVLTGAALPLLIVVAGMGSLGIYLVARIPTVRSAPRAALAPA